jgi:FO synthase subunit 1
MPPGEVIATLTRGAALGCTEALFTFGERPEREEGFSGHMHAVGYANVLEYCYAMCKQSIAIGILPHTNAGIMTYDEMAHLREVNASMGLMLETTAELPAHRNSPGKQPEVRIEMIENAGHLKIPFTTGLLVGIGENNRDREESLEEVIIQNFCPKEGTPMGDARIPDKSEFCSVIRMAREILPPDVAVQIPPNLADAAHLIDCGVNDLGGVSPLTIDYVNPEHPWPAIDRLHEVVGDAELRERLCIYPQFIEKGWYHPNIEGLIRQLREVIQERES